MSEYWPIERLKPYERNPRKNDKAVDRIRASIRGFGFAVPILAKSDGEIIDGHLRLKGGAAEQISCWSHGGSPLRHSGWPECARDGALPSGRRRQDYRVPSSRLSLTLSKPFPIMANNGHAFVADFTRIDMIDGGPGATLLLTPFNVPIRLWVL
jgi:hypothetical protein